MWTKRGGIFEVKGIQRGETCNIGLAVGARKGDVVEYFEINNNKEGYSLNSQDISVKKYKIMLWKAIKDVPEIAGYDIVLL